MSERSHCCVWQLYLNIVAAADLLLLRSFPNFIRLRLRQSCALVTLLVDHVEGHLCFLGEMTVWLMLWINNSQDFVELLPLIPQHIQILFVGSHVSIVTAGDHFLLGVFILGSVIYHQLPDLLGRIFFKVSFLTVTTWERFDEIRLLNFELLSSFIFPLPLFPFG